jgi:phosphate-selective porin OprO and OprP
MKRVFVLAAVVLVGTSFPVAGQTVVPAAAQQNGDKESEKQAEKQDKDSVEATGDVRVKKGAKESNEDWGFRWADHPSIRLGPGTRVDFRLRLQGDLQSSEVDRLDDADLDDLPATDIARRRIGIEGEILNLFDYQVERELAKERDPWRDVYVNYKQFGFAEVQAGKFKLPFSLDENTSATNLDFVYRSRSADLLAPGRDRGVMVHGRVLPRGVLRYELGAFREDGSNAHRSNADYVSGDRTFAGRVLVQPFRSTKSLASDLAIGVAFTTSDINAGVTGLRGRTELDAPFYSPAFLVNGQRRRIGFEARWRPGPFSIKSEYIRLTDERLGQSVEDTDLPPFVAAGWYVSGTWALTGETKADGLDSPRRPIFQGGFGAIELAVRVERIRFGSIDDPLASNAPRAEVILGNSDRVYTMGVNWYANRWIKIQANLVRNTIAFPDQGPLPSQPGFWTRLVRFQFSM